MKPVSYSDPIATLITDPVVETKAPVLPEDWQDHPADLISPSTDDVLIAMETRAMAEACIKGLITKQQLMEYIRS